MSSEIRILTPPAETIQAYGTPLTATREGTLSYLPVALFGAVMGLTGLSSAWKFADSLYGLPSWIAGFFSYIAILAFLLVGTGYAIKAATGFKAVKAEFQHPIAGNLFGTLFISLLLIPNPLSDYSLSLARWIWVMGTLGMILFAWVIISRWLGQQQQPGHATPAWLIPMVGLINIPIAVPTLQIHGQDELLMFSLAIGFFFAIPLFTLIMSRLIFEKPLILSLQPSFMILVAPFAVGFSAYVNVVGEVDRFATALYMLTIFLLSVMIGRLRYLAIVCPFRLSWWSVSFPLASASVCALRYAKHSPNLFTHAVAIVLLIGVTLILLSMSVKTVSNLLKGNLKLLMG
ncbi:tellurite resistance protein [Pseudomonas helmanticensis]|uniref:Tellurite resistance protein n=1 Tax=Pseudomonas helmanticensis TaxID=1471381 RepID=A0ACD2UDB7_9PSED|nr:SLAC1 anion channel family protein [Pseudomonas helmanticensis]SMQ30371.1 tellurite resistance protein [Pseudomonas helmanticensis]